MVMPLAAWCRPRYIDLAVESLVSRDVIWQPGQVAEESVTAMTDGLGNGQETSGHGDRVIADKLVPFD